MGVYHNLFIGPYAEFRVPPGQVEKFPPEDEGGDLLAWQTLMCDLGLEERHSDCYRYMPSSAEEQHAPRTMYAGDKGGGCFPTQDLTELDRQGEIAWFAKRYANELRLLAERFGGEPTLHWGVVCWYS